ncbi:type III-A CRISPR-associated RAMP protein Csm5 [Candidatus Kuenenia stuttgartiensis]|uniref:type III-A CRISPR-associated RAMP protein Csm5 n=1 Tax=Kuenenia stuttgartiensis TaxID=174633 RepID=UPI001E653E77|nr:type III-A CRISPR-associated RAMP protein Csm5 [Candidatus Kuenenia stuttgartiensis]
MDKTSSYSSHCNINIQGNIRSCIRNAFSQPYLPGSAIKGVIRTSIMYVILKRLNDTLRKKILTDFVQKKLLEYKKDPRGEQGYSWFKERFKQWFAQRLDEEIFQKFVIKNNQKRYDPHSDILRCIQISDSNSIDTGNLHLEEVKIFSADSAKSPKDWSVFVECIPAGNEFTFQCKIDEWLLNKFKENNPSNSFGVAFSELKKILSNPFEAVNEMTSDLLREEESFFSQKLKLKNILNFGNETPNFRLGWGMGLLGTSVAMLLPAETKQDLRNILFTDRGDSPAPKSRRIITSNHSSYAILGWCVVENNI